MIRQIARATVYPGLTLGSVALVWWAWRAGLPAPAALAALGLLLVPTIYALERLLPFERAWLEDRGDGAVDWLHLLLTARCFDLGVGVPPALVALWRGGEGSGPWWPSSWPLLAQVLLLLLLSESVAYAYHRAQHEIPLLWRIHRVHHSAPRVYFVNVARNHPLDALSSGLLSAVPVALLGPGQEALVAAGAFSAAHALMQHCNIDMRLGPLKRLISGPEAHRFHHSADLAESNANYGQLLLVFDLLLGTLKIPSGRARPEAVGLAGGEAIDDSYRAHLLDPWRPIR